MPNFGNCTFNELISYLIERYGMAEILDNLAVKAFHSPSFLGSYANYSELTGRLEKLTDDALKIEAGEPIESAEGGQSNEQQ